MILRNYLFSKEFDVYQQYPNDIAKQFLSPINSNQLSVDQIVIHRDGNLIYYAYIQSVSTNKVFGHCIVTGDICTNIKVLYDLFHKSIEQAACKGVLFSFDSTGKISKQTGEFSNEGAEVNEFFKDFNRIANQNSLWKSIGSIDFSVSKDSKIYLSLTDDSNNKIVEAIEHYHNVVITIENPLASSYSNIVKQLNLDKEELNGRIEHLTNENDELLKKKKQYKIVVTLFVIIILCCIGLLSFYREITGKTQHIQELENEITGKTQHIQELENEITGRTQHIQELENEITIKRDSLLLQNNEINRLINDLSIADRRLSSAQKELSDYKNKFIPLIVTDIEIANVTEDGKIETGYGGTIYSKNSMYLRHRIKYIGLKEGRVEFYIKLYRPNGSLSVGDKPKEYSYSVSEFIYEGVNKSRELNVWWGNKNKGHWVKGTYKVEVWYKDVCLESKTFTIY